MLQTLEKSQFSLLDHLNPYDLQTPTLYDMQKFGNPSLNYSLAKPHWKARRNIHVTLNPCIKWKMEQRQPQQGANKNKVMCTHECMCICMHKANKVTDQFKRMHILHSNTSTVFNLSMWAKFSTKCNVKLYNNTIWQLLH